jgi:5-hydroxyisourate hydrolase
MARISTHVLDVERGQPAAGIPIELYRGGILLGSSETNVDGRTDEPMLTVDRVEPGCYELVFRAGDYLSRRDPDPFYNDITIRFRVSDATGNYHIPLLLAAHGYSTYRGS